MTTSESSQKVSATTAVGKFQGLLGIDTVVAPPPETAAGALIPDPAAEYERWRANPEAYWDEVARSLEWFAPYERVLDWQYPYARWFDGGKCNITVNCLDRHGWAGRGDKLAWLWLGEDGEEQRFTYAEVLVLVNRIANGLKGLGVQRGDRVCIYLPLTPEGMATMLACARIGAIHSVVYAGLGSGALRDRLVDAGAKVIVTADESYRRGKVVSLKPIVDEAIVGLDYVANVVVFRRNPRREPLKAPLEIDFDTLISGQAEQCEPEIMESEDRLFLLYTSGTTGKPKGPVYVHGGYAVGTSHLCGIAYDLKDDDLYWCTSDIGWIVGHSSMVYGPMINGVSLLVREGAPDHPHPGIFWETVEKYRVTKIFTAPTTLRMFMKLGPDVPAKYDLSSLRLLICAGEPLNPEAWQFAYEHVTRRRAPVCDNWWQTETAAPTLGTLPAQPAKPGRVGTPLPGYLADVVDRSGAPVPPGQGGFLVMRDPWPQMMRTIWNDDARYEEYWNQIPGCYFAGDVATKDEDGYICVLGRADDVLNVAGHRIGTADVESALVAHPAVAEAAVIGKPDPIKGEAIKAFVILRLGHQESDELQRRLVEHVRHELGPIATPSEFVFVPKLPKTRSGKIMRRLLKAQELGLDPGDVTTLEE